MRTLSMMLGAGALIGFAGGCFITNTAHCGYHENGAENPCPVGFVCSACASANNGCVPVSEADAIEPSCREGGGTTGPTTESSTADPTVGPTSMPTTTETSTTDDTTIGVTTMGPTSTTDSTTTQTTETSTTEAPSTTIETMCDPGNLNDPNCGEQYCVAQNQCGWCTSLPEDKTCNDVNTATPACDEASGLCVECTEQEAQLCTGATPTCDPETHECVPCTEHSQCGSTACDIFEGSCFPEQSVFFVKGGKVDCQAKTGLTADSPFCKLTDVPLDAAKTTVRLLASNDAPGGLSVPAGKVVAIVKHNAGIPEINGANILGPSLQVSGAGARLYISGVKLRFAQGALVKCTGARLYAHDSWWDGNNLNAARGIEGSSCDVSIHRSRIVRCGAAMQLTAGSLWMENSFVMENGANTAAHTAFNFVNAVQGTITYSTIARNRVIGGLSAFKCGGNPSTITVRNSAVIGVNPITDCGAALSFVNGRVEETADETAANIVMNQWFNPGLEDVYTPRKSDNMDPLEDMAVWQEGDPRRDFSNEAVIPTEDPSFAGARQPL
ncbi:hypothetical protein [Nannocystis bainbridge]|uniref:Right handed beta helix domain-containing protein n=1 Tax=Nannocystis bainbridge TaxID=2995303 RepID=A0ABT5E0S4_9BACT|nr:hypothetical protein [Nannocystis bainbridge]MDC0719485.1 hypothetical protein [Nannocystis bainbridge]